MTLKDFFKQDMNDMTENEAEEIGCMGSVITVILFLSVLLICSLICGCSPKVTEHIIVKTDTVFQQQIRYDSIFKHDSIYLHEWSKGETIYIERTKWHTQYKERLRIDTTYISHTDTLIQEKVKEVPAKISDWKRLQMMLGRIFMVVLGGLVIYAIFKAKKALF